jgi:hypothetical protein
MKDTEISNNSSKKNNLVVAAAAVVLVVLIVVPIAVVARSKTWTVFARSNAGIVGSNPTQGMDVYVRLFCVCVWYISSISSILILYKNPGQVVVGGGGEDA